MLKWNRRQFLSGLLAAVSASAASSAQALPIPMTSLDDGAAPPLPASAEPVVGSVDGSAAHGLQQLLPEGLRFGRWRVVSVLPVKLGAVPVVLESCRGERFQVDVLRRDRSARARRGLAETRAYSLFLLNRGQGDTPTQEDHGLAVLWLAALLRPREGSLGAVALLTQRERTQRFPRGKFNALVAAAPPSTATPGDTLFEAPPSEATWSFANPATPEKLVGPETRTT